MAFDKKEANTMKKLKRGTGINHHDVSQEFKELGYLHKDGRLINYCP